MKAAITLAKGNFERETAKAYLIDVGDCSVWFPKSQLEVYQDVSIEEYQRPFFLIMPIWLAKQKGLWGYNCYGKKMCSLIEDDCQIQIKLGDNWEKVN